MKHNSKLTSIVFYLCLLLVLPQGVYAQQEDVPSKIKSEYSAGKLVALYNLDATSRSDFSCAFFKRNVTIVDVKYKDDDTIWLYVKINSKEEFIINFMLDDIPRKDVSNFKDLFVAGKKVRIGTFACGASGSVVFLDSIELLSIFCTENKLPVKKKKPKRR